MCGKEYKTNLFPLLLSYILEVKLGAVHLCWFLAMEKFSDKVAFQQQFVNSVKSPRIKK